AADWGIFGAGVQRAAAALGAGRCVAGGVRAGAASRAEDSGCGMRLVSRRRRPVWKWRRRWASTQGAERGSGDLIRASGGGRIVWPCERTARGKRRACELGQSSCDGAAQVIVGGGVAARKARAAELEGGLTLSDRRGGA